MKTIKFLTMFLAGILFNNMSAQNCNASGGAYNSSTSGVVQILDSSSTTSGPSATYSWITFYDSNGNYVSTVSLQPSTDYTTYTFSSNGTYTYYLEVNDSITNCYDSIGGSVTITGLNNGQTGSCDASFSAYLDTVNSNTIYYAATNTNYTNYYWSFGDGNYSNNNTSGYHSYANDGTYTIELAVYNYDSLGNYICADTVYNTVTINSSGGQTGSCDASFSAYLDTANSNTIYYAATNTNYTNYYWSFGDGNYSNNNVNGYHSYANDGTYTIELAVYNYDSLGNYICADTVYSSITINTNGASNCDATANLVDTSGYLYGMPYTYNSNYDYYWDFGDGNTSTQAYAWHQYANPGTYTVCLTVIDSVNMCSDNQCYTYVVTAPTSCDASFYLFQDSVNAGLYYAWNMSTGNNLSYSWDFGDGNTSTQQFPTHTYTTVGVYSLCLTVDDGNGCVDTFCDTINVVVKSNGTTIHVTPAGQTVGVVEQTINEVSVYPNPTNGDLNLELNLSKSSEISIQVMNHLGQIVTQNPLQILNNGSNVKLNLNDQPSGIYIVRVLDETNGESKNIKVIKQ